MSALNRINQYANAHFVGSGDLAIFNYWES